MSHSRIEVEGVQVLRRGQPILDVSHLAVASSEIVAVVGPNGAGKSTLVQVMGLLLKPDRGRVTVAGERVTRKREHALRKRLACVFQSPHLLDKSVSDNVALGLRLRAIQAGQRTRQVERWLVRLGLEGLKENRAKTLSGGEAQRVNLARALALRPEVLLLDEPFGGLDAPTRHALMADLGPLVREGAGSALLVTHDRRVALALGDRVAVMLNGQLRQIGPPDEVFTFPADEEIARFVGVENLIPAVAKGGEIRIAESLVLRGPASIDGDVTIALRSEEVHLGPTPLDSEEANQLSGTIRRIRRSGVGFALDVDFGVEINCRVTRAELGRHGYSTGQTVYAAIRPAALHRLPRHQ